VITPHDLEWHLTTAAERLVIHLVPWALMLWIAALVRTGFSALPTTAPGSGPPPG
jgi:hypothetical protein